jgi:DNA-binding NarL/FixJ family response regulator
VCSDLDNIVYGASSPLFIGALLLLGVRQILHPFPARLYKSVQRVALMTFKLCYLPLRNSDISFKTRRESRHCEHGFRSKELLKSPGSVGTVKVFIADGSQLSCQLIAAAVRRGRYRTRVVGFATDATGIREGLAKKEADVAVIGARLEGEDLAGFQVTREILASRTKPNVIIILDSNKPKMVVEAFRAGASGIFSRDQSSELLCKCIHAVHRGQVWASSKELHFLIEALGTALPAKSICTRGSGLLTTREEGVVHLVAEGLTNRDISHQLNLSEHTVRNYLFRIFNKVGTSNRLELALYAIDRRGSHDQQISPAAMDESVMAGQA